MWHIMKLWNTVKTPDLNQPDQLICAQTPSKTSLAKLSILDWFKADFL